jgi:hypothetical protein
MKHSFLPFNSTRVKSKKKFIIIESIGQIRSSLRCHNENQGMGFYPPLYIKLDVMDNILSKKFAITFFF